MSDFSFILPTPITDTNMLACSIPENQHIEWAGGGFESLNTTNRNWQAICRSSSDKLWACVYGGGIYYSTDEGLTWTDYGAGSKDYKGICARGTDIYVSVYNGSIWKLTGESGAFSDLVQTARKWGHMCVCTDNHVWCTDETSGVDTYKQTDGAGSFAKDQDVCAHNACYGIICAPNADMYVLTNNGLSSSYIYHRSGTSGAFTELSSGWIVWQMYKTGRGICADSQNNIYIGTTNYGVWMRPLGAGNFAQIAGAPTLAYRGMCVDGNDSIFACVYAGSIYKADGFQNYSIGDYCQVTTGGTHKIYQSLIDSNTGNNPTTDDGTKWLDCGATMRYKPFDTVVGTQATDAGKTTIRYVFACSPETDSDKQEDSIAVLNHAGNSIRIVEIEGVSNLLSSGDWTGATGTTQPTGWDLVGTPSDFTIQSDIALKITVDANGEGISKSVAVTPATEYQLLIFHKNTASDVAQYGVYDVTHSADIKATTDLTDSTADEYYPTSYIFTTPAGCTSVKISLLGKTAGDIVYIKDCYLAETVYNSLITTGEDITDTVKTDLIKSQTSIFTVEVNGTSIVEKIGDLVFGVSSSLGTLMDKPAPTFGITNYSSKSTDAFGNITINATRGYAKYMTGRAMVSKANTDIVNNLYIDYKDTPMVFLGSLTETCLMIYGYWSEYEGSRDCPNFSFFNFRIEGLT